MPLKVMRKGPKQHAVLPLRVAKHAVKFSRRLTIRDLGWTRERAREVRAQLATFAADWDNPGMDIYDEP
jgi:hypothetical protein